MAIRESQFSLLFLNLSYCILHLNVLCARSTFPWLWGWLALELITFTWFFLFQEFFTLPLNSVPLLHCTTFGNPKVLYVFLKYIIIPMLVSFVNGNNQTDLEKTLNIVNMYLKVWFLHLQQCCPMSSWPSWCLSFTDFASMLVRITLQKKIIF